MLSAKLRIQGFSLTELMIAIAIGSILLTSLVTLYMVAVKHSQNTLNTSRLHQEMQTVMDIITNDIRRAGFWAQAASDINTGNNTNPFMAAGMDLSVNAGNDCVLLSYDRDKDGVLAAIGSAGDDERYAYRLNGQTIQARIPNATFSCTAPASTWEDITDPNIIQITGLTFTKTDKVIDLDGAGAGTATIILRNIDIGMTGELTDDATVNNTLNRSVRNRNDKYAP